MAGPWEEYQQSENSAPQGPWGEFAQPAKPPARPYSGAILPFSKDAQGRVSFDSNAGIVGAVRRALTLPGEVYRGEIDPKSDAGIARAAEMAGVVSPMTPAVRATGAVIPGETTAMKRQAVNPPTIEELKAASQSGYSAVRGMGAEYPAQAATQMASGLRANLEKEGFLAAQAPSTHAVIDGLSSAPATAPGERAFMPFEGLESARKSFGRTAGNFQNPTDQLAARHGIEAIDKFFEANAPQGVMAGADAAKGPDIIGLLKDARANYAAAKRSENIADANYRAELQAARAGSGTNTDNSIRQRITSILLNDKKSAGYNPAEITALEGVVEGSKPRNAMRFIGNLLGGGGGLGGMAGIAAGAGGGAMAGGPVGGTIGAMAAPAIGAASKFGANKLAEKSLENADKMVRMRSPLYEMLASEAPMIPENRSGEMTLLRMLLGENLNNSR